jgi:putative phage-type endonuclease
MIIVDCEQRTEEWYQARLGVLTASDAHKYASKRKESNQYIFTAQKLAERLTGTSKDGGFDSPDMKWGRDNEDAARQAYEAQTGNKVEELGFVLQDDRRLLGASPDGLIGDKGLIEIKCMNSHNHILSIKEGNRKGSTDQGIKSDHMTQMKIQMYVLQREWCDYVIYDPRLPENLQLYIRRVHMCPEYLTDCIHIEDKFRKELEWISELIGHKLEI